MDPKPKLQPITLKSFLNIIPINDSKIKKSCIDKTQCKDKQKCINNICVNFDSGKIDNYLMDEFDTNRSLTTCIKDECGQQQYNLYLTQILEKIKDFVKRIKKSNNDKRKIEIIKEDFKKFNKFLILPNKTEYYSKTTNNIDIMEMCECTCCIEEHTEILKDYYNFYNKLEPKYNNLLDLLETVLILELKRIIYFITYANKNNKTCHSKAKIKLQKKASDLYSKIIQEIKDNIDNSNYIFLKLGFCNLIDKDTCLNKKELCIYDKKKNLCLSAGYFKKSKKNLKKNKRFKFITPKKNIRK